MVAKGEQLKTQPSINAFFKRKSPPTSSPLRGSVSDSSPDSKRRKDLPNAIEIEGEDEDGEEVIDLTSSPPDLTRSKPAFNPKAQSQRSPWNTGSTANSLKQPSSSYFNKPKALSQVIQLSLPTSTSSDQDAGARVVENGSSTRLSGRPVPVPSSSTSLETYKLPRSLPSRSVQAGSAFDTYSLQPTEPSAPSSSQPRIRTAEEQKRHEEWQRRVSAPGGVIRRRRSLALDEAAAAEARRQLGGGEDGDASPDEGVSTPIVEDLDEEEKKKAEDVGKGLKAKYAAKGAAAEGKGKGKGKKKEEVGPSGQTYTPLEKQYMEIKAQWPDVLLLTEVGYKYKFHGEDAKTASKELGIAAFPNRNFYSASIPVHRLHIHVKKLISLGYKVGVVSQMETAALKKVGDNRNSPFTRELTHLYTAATYVEEASLGSSSTLGDEPITPRSAPPPTNALVGLVEQGLGGLAGDDRVRIGLVSVVPGTGDVVWDEFDDSQVRSELETRLTHLQPAELLLPSKGLSKATEKVLAHLAGATKTSGKAAVRVERIDNIQTYDAAFDYLTRYYRRKAGPASGVGRRRMSEEIDLTGDSDGGNGNGPEVDSQPVENGTQSQKEDVDPIGLAAGLPSEEAVLALVDFPKQVVVALAVAVKHMKDFGLENAFRHRSSFTKFINRAHMLLSSNTLINLEIYRNQTDGGVYGSLLWLLDHTKTRMGKRLLREWIGRPLLDVRALQARIDAIEEIMENNQYHMEKLRSLLVNMPDLVRGLTRIQYGKATPTEIATILVGLVRVSSEFKPDEGEVFKSDLLNSILKILPTIREASRSFLNALNVKEARANNKANLWNDLDKYPDIQDAKDCISICESELDLHLKEVRKLLKRPTLNYVTVSAIEYLVEVPTREAKTVPPKWVKISSTKSVVRFHTPEILKMTKEREQYKETLAAAADRAFLSFQADVSECHELVVVARQLAVIDCLMSLAQVAAASGYCKPTFVAEPVLHIREGRHPMVESLREDPYVPFDIDFSGEEGKSKVITGPNMAGKSSCVRATALIVCMAQIGSFVPASSVTLGIHDAVQTRMGATDEIGRGKSTFMVELSETSDILRTVSPRTLVILDELGRGTSTYDGVAIAYATLSHLAGIGCNTLFVTHYPMVAEELAKENPQQISNWHMSFDESTLPDGSKEITFLYKLTRGLAEASFGVWCARLAGLPPSVLKNAQSHADHLKYETGQRLIAATARRSQRLFRDIQVDSAKSVPETLKNISTLYKALTLSTVV